MFSVWNMLNSKQGVRLRRDENWVSSFIVPWDRVSPGLRLASSHKKRPKHSERLDMVRKVCEAISVYTQLPGRAALRDIGILGFNASATARVISRQWNDDEISFLVEETGVPGGNHRPTASNWWNFFTHTASAQSGGGTCWNSQDFRLKHSHLDGREQTLLGNWRNHLQMIHQWSTGCTCSSLQSTLVI